MHINLKQKLKEAIDSEDETGIHNAIAEGIAKKHKTPIEVIELMMEWGLPIEMETFNDETKAKEEVLLNLATDPIYYKQLKELEE